MRTFLLLLPIEGLVLGKIYTKLPLHCTLVQYFELNDDVSETIRRHIDRCCQELDIGSIELVADEPDLFGKDHDVPVYRIHHTDTLYALHQALVSLIRECGGRLHNPEWADDGYKPHVTTVDGRAFVTGSSKKLRRICLVERLPDGSKRAHADFLF